MSLVAHRGESADAPENTIPAFELAWTRGSDAVECDVYVTKDQQLLCAHDENLSRVAGVDVNITALTAEQARLYDVGKWKDKQFAGSKIPYLSEVFRTVPAKNKVFVEIKNSSNGDFTKLLDEARKNAGLSVEQVVIISFSAEYLKIAEKNIPQYKRYYLWGKNDGDPVKLAEQVIPIIKSVKANGGDFGGKALLTKEFFHAIKAAGLEFHAWTIDDPDEAQMLVDLGVDSITTNRSGYIRHMLNCSK